eukprot:8811528-Lingulodinium_polyedra.AAC.1
MVAPRGRGSRSIRLELLATPGVIIAGHPDQPPTPVVARYVHLGATIHQAARVSGARAPRPS